MVSKPNYTLEADVRHEIGKGASRRLRRQAKVPGVLYGGNKPATALAFEHKHLAKSLENEAFYSRILTLISAGESERVVLKDLQRHPYKPLITHIDFQRVRADEKLHMHIPMHFVGDKLAPGVNDEGGVLSHLINDVEIMCLPDDLPEFLEIDVSHLHLNDILHLSDIKLPKGVEIVALAHGDDKPIASVHMPRIEEPEEVDPDAPVAPSEVPASAQKAPDEKK